MWKGPLLTATMSQPDDDLAPLESFPRLSRKGRYQTHGDLRSGAKDFPAQLPVKKKNLSMSSINRYRHEDPAFYASIREALGVPPVRRQLSVKVSRQPSSQLDMDLAEFKFQKEAKTAIGDDITEEGSGSDEGEEYKISARHLPVEVSLDKKDRPLGAPDAKDKAQQEDKVAVEMSSGSSWAVILSAAKILGGGSAAVIMLELITRFDNGAGVLLTFFQFLVVAMDGMRSQLEEKKGGGVVMKKPKIPMGWHITFVVICFCMSVLSNITYQYHISVALHIIIKSGGLVMNMILGWFILGKRYNLQQVCGVMTVFAGIALASWDGGKQTSSGSDHDGDVNTFLIGIGLLVISLALSSTLGILQEMSYSKYGNHWQESMFYSHFLSLPLFMMGGSDLWDHVRLWNSSPGLRFLPFVPEMWLYLVLNVCLAYLAVSGIYSLMAHTSSLTTQVVITLRKALSLLVSVFIFNTAFGTGGWIGSGMVFCGTMWYVKASGGKGKHKSH